MGSQDYQRLTSAVVLRTIGGDTGQIERNGKGKYIL